MPEEVVEQILRIKIRQLGAQPLFDACHLAPNSLDKRERGLRRLGYGIQHVENPFFPKVLGAHHLKQSIVIGLRASYV